MGTSSKPKTETFALEVCFRVTGTDIKLVVPVKRASNREQAIQLASRKLEAAQRKGIEIEDPEVWFR